MKPFLFSFRNEYIDNVLYLAIDQVKCYLFSFPRKTPLTMAPPPRPHLTLENFNLDSEVPENWSERSACAALGCWHKRRWP